MATVAYTPRVTTITPAISTVGPFLVGFRLFEADGLDVYVGGQKLAQDAFTVIATFVDGYDDGASVTLDVEADVDVEIRIEGAMRPARNFDYIPTDPSVLQKINVEFGRIWAVVMELRREASRSLRTATENAVADLPDGAVPLWKDGAFIAGPDAGDITQAQGYAQIAQDAADLALSAANFSAADIPGLIADTTNYPLGATIITRLERRTFEVVASDPDITTAAGVFLKLRPLLGLSFDVRPYFRAEGEVNDGTLRIPQRMFMGDHWNFYGALDKEYNAANGSGYSWLDRMKADGLARYLIDKARAAVTTTNSLAITGAARSVNNGGGAIGLTGIGFIESTASPITGDRHAWGLYTETHLRGDLSPTYNVRAHGAEIAVGNYIKDFGKPSPFGGLPSEGFATGLTINSGVGLTSETKYPILWGLRFESIGGANGGQFHTGILFRQDALVPDTQGYTSAMIMPGKTKLQWFGQGYAETFYITSNAISNAERSGILVNAFGLNYRNENGATAIFFNKGDGIAAGQSNYFNIKPGGSGQAPRFEVQGVDADIDAYMIPKGSGRFRLSYAFPSASAPANFNPNRMVELKDGTGATVYVAASTTPW